MLRVPCRIRRYLTCRRSPLQSHTHLQHLGRLLLLPFVRLRPRFKRLRRSRALLR
jgi:hypothetical protein